MSNVVSIEKARYQRQVKRQAPKFHAYANSLPEGPERDLYSAIARNDTVAARQALAELGHTLSA